MKEEHLNSSSEIWITPWTCSDTLPTQSLSKWPCSEWDECIWLNHTSQSCFASGNHKDGSVEKVIWCCSDPSCSCRANFHPLCCPLTGRSTWSAMSILLGTGPDRWNLAWKLPLDNWEAA